MALKFLEFRKFFISSSVVKAERCEAKMDWGLVSAAVRKAELDDPIVAAARLCRRPYFVTDFHVVSSVLVLSCGFSGV